MRQRIFATTVLIALLSSSVPLANAETFTISCGAGATYSLVMPRGVAMNGNNCSGALTLDLNVKIIDAIEFYRGKISLEMQKITQNKLQNILTASRYKILGVVEFGR